MCTYYAKTGTCKYGKECRFDHPPRYFVPRNSCGFPLRLGEPVCEHYVKKGRCKFGEACKYHHPETEKKPEPEKQEPVKSKAPPEKPEAEAGTKKWGPGGAEPAESAADSSKFASEAHAWPELS